MGRRRGGNGGMSEYPRVRGQRPKTLVDNALLRAKSTNLAIIGRVGIESILQNARFYAGSAVQLLQFRQRVAVADPRLPDAAGGGDFFNRAPHLQCLLRGRKRRMQDEAIQVVRLQVSQRGGEGLGDLLRQGCCRIVGYSTRILPGSRREL